MAEELDIEPVEIMCLQMEYHASFAEDPHLKEVLLYGARTIRFLDDTIAGLMNSTEKALVILDSRAG